jgi:predicted DNA-binding protein
MCENVFMANTRSSTFSIRLNPETKKRLTKLAKESGRSANFLISDAVESYVADQERMLAEIRQADRLAFVLGHGPRTAATKMCLREEPRQ